MRHLPVRHLWVPAAALGLAAAVPDPPLDWVPERYHQVAETEGLVLLRRDI